LRGIDFEYFTPSCRARPVLSRATRISSSPLFLSRRRSSPRSALATVIALSTTIVGAVGGYLMRLGKTVVAGERLEAFHNRLAEEAAARFERRLAAIELRLARPLDDPARILPLLARGLGDVDAGFGIDRMRLEAVQVEPLPPRQIAHAPAHRSDRLEDLVTRLGIRIGLENILRFLPADSHIPERGFILAPAAWSEPGGAWAVLRSRPLRLFPSEPIAARGARPPRHFRWRGMALSVARTTGPERIAPEWWLDDPGWRSGLRDYWHVETRQGRRLWLYHTPQEPGWFVQGEFA